MIPNKKNALAVVLTMLALARHVASLVHPRACLFSRRHPLTIRFASTTIEDQIKAKGDEIRALKQEGADKATVAPLVQELLALKAQLDPPAETKKSPKTSKQDDEDEDLPSSFDNE